ncbi:NUDIX domain-containing protein [Kurthia sibirica]|uniref:Nucleoside triphosphatase n=1 Tax=Kurthia sibirica TaxID=202750 RepID=A0A2U3AJT8_9BACL|nr:NUDIX domain-containing protein [Kurthia sibirica]PWI24787.1 nucleoside triphosphatase [Kurthia sibirica]GEK34891.1 nucleoside triphosphatase YtkD [Kurthia sibirica]
MFSYTDLNGTGVELSFKKNAFPIQATHVLVIAKYKGLWVLTDHPIRGIEFPGGKAEVGEDLAVAAAREMAEETGAIITNIEWLATYLVQDDQPFAKAVFVANVASIQPEFKPRETNGLVLLTEEEFNNAENLSFHMKDSGMKKMLERMSERENC